MVQAQISAELLENNVDEGTSSSGNFEESHAFGVTKSLNKKEIAAGPGCQHAIKNEADALVQAGTLDENTEFEREKLISWAQANENQITIL